MTEELKYTDGTSVNVNALFEEMERIVPEKDIRERFESRQPQSPKEVREGKLHERDQREKAYDKRTREEKKREGGSGENKE